MDKIPVQFSHVLYLSAIHASPFIQNLVSISEECASGQDISYQLSYAADSGTHITTCVVDGTECSNSTCHHELQNNTADSRCQPPVPQFSDEDVTVSVIARNIVGRSNSAVSRSLSKFICWATVQFTHQQ